MMDIKSVFQNQEAAPVFVAAEIGINHEGDFDFAKKLIDSAKESGADAVKFQVFKTDQFYHPKISPDAYQLFRGFELSFDKFNRLKEHAESLGLVFFATPLDFESLHFLVDIHTPIIKVASSDITNEPFLSKIADMGAVDRFVTILSTGFVGLKEIKKAVRFFKDASLALLYCVSKYPADVEDFDLNFIRTLQENLYFPIGFSDHSKDIHLTLGAVALGAKIIERHFTTDDKLPGYDHAMSLSPTRFKEMVAGIRVIEKALGSGVKKVTDFENKIRQGSMRSLYTAKAIKKGDRIGENDVLLLRPGNGVSLSYYRKIVGRKAPRDLGEYEEV